MLDRFRLFDLCDDGNIRLFELRFQKVPELQNIPSSAHERKRQSIDSYFLDSKFRKFFIMLGQSRNAKLRAGKIYSLMRSENPAVLDADFYCRFGNNIFNIENDRAIIEQEQEFFIGKPRRRNPPESMRRRVAPRDGHPFAKLKELNIA